MTSAAKKQKLHDLSESVKKNSPVVRQNAKKNGGTQNEAIVHSVSKYLSALKKLESE